MENSLRNESKEWIKMYVDGEYSKGITDESINALDQFLAINASAVPFDQFINDMVLMPDMQRKNNIRNFSDIEKFAKAIGITIGEESFNNENYAPLMKSLKKLPDGVALKDENVNKYKGVIRHYLNVYQFRNAVTHDSSVDITMMKLNGIITSSLVCMLDLAYTFRNRISQCYAEKIQDQTLDKVKYARSVVKRFKNNNYVNLYWRSSSDDDFDAASLISSDYEFVKILGEAGSGKSTVLQRIAYLMASRVIKDSSAPLPIYIALSDLSVVDDIFVNSISKELKIPEEDVDQMISRNSICLLLDGYNEILDKTTLRAFAGQLDNLVIKYPKLRLFVADRAISSSRLLILKDAYRLYLRPLSMEEKKKFIETVSDDKETIEMISADMDNNPLLYSELNTPLKLKHYLEVVEKTGRIVLDWVAPYIEMLFEREIIDKKDETINYLPECLSGLALEMNTNRINIFEAQAKIAKVSDLLGYTKNVDTKLMVNLAIDMGILTANDNEISFQGDEYYYYFLQNGEDTGLAEVLGNI